MEKIFSNSNYPDTKPIHAPRSNGRPNSPDPFKILNVSVTVTIKIKCPKCGFTSKIGVTERQIENDRLIYNKCLMCSYRSYADMEDKANAKKSV